MTQLWCLSLSFYIFVPWPGVKFSALTEHRVCGVRRGKAQGLRAEALLADSARILADTCQRWVASVSGGVTGEGTSTALLVTALQLLSQWPVPRVVDQQPQPPVLYDPQVAWCKLT